MELKTIEEAKKYIGKIIYTAYSHTSREKPKVVELYIGGVNLHYNQSVYEVEGFSLWEDKDYKEFYGDIKKDRIAEEFNPEQRNDFYYFTSKLSAKEYCFWLQRDEMERQKEYDIKTAKELLDSHKVKYEIFD